MRKNPTHSNPPLPSIPLSPCLLQQNFCFLFHYRTSLLSPSNSQIDLGHSQDEPNSIGKGKYYYSSFKSKTKRVRGLRYCLYSLERNELKPLIMGFSDLYQEGLGICKKKNSYYSNSTRTQVFLPISINPVIAFRKKGRRMALLGRAEPATLEDFCK